MDPAGRRLKIPVWMLLAECADIKISQQPHLGNLCKTHLPMAVI